VPPFPLSVGDVPLPLPRSVVRDDDDPTVRTKAVAA